MTEAASWWVEKLAEFEASRGRQAKKPGPKKPAVATVTVQDGDTVLKLMLDHFTLDVDRDYVDASAFGDVNKTYLAGRRTIKLEGDIANGDEWSVTTQYDEV